MFTSACFEKSGTVSVPYFIGHTSSSSYVTHVGLVMNRDLGISESQFLVLLPEMENGRVETLLALKMAG